MFENEEDLRKWLKEKFPYVEKNDEEIKKEFIESFGIEKWEEEEALKPLMDLSFKLCDYLEIDPVPILFEEMEEDARYYNGLNYIGISTKYVHDEIEARKSLIHEIKHLHQKHCISHKNETLKYAPSNLLKEWTDDFEKNQRKMPYGEVMCMPVEVDAFAFTKYILKIWFNYDYHHYDEAYDALLTIYMNKYFK